MRIVPILQCDCLLPRISAATGQGRLWIADRYSVRIVDACGYRSDIVVVVGACRIWQGVQLMHGLLYRAGCICPFAYFLRSCSSILRRIDRLLSLKELTRHHLLGEASSCRFIVDLLRDCNHFVISLLKAYVLNIIRNVFEQIRM